MLPENRIPTHPGEVLLEEFLNPLALSKVAFTTHIGVPVQRINEIVRGKRGITPETAWLFAAAFGTPPNFGLTYKATTISPTPTPSVKLCGLLRLRNY